MTIVVSWTLALQRGDHRASHLLPYLQHLPLRLGLQSHFLQTTMMKNMITCRLLHELNRNILHVPS
mgnify:CR=1 FL=1